MKILAISQVYWPDTASVAQHLTDLLEALRASNHSVHVFSSQRKYEEPKNKFPKTENHKGVYINRINNTGLGKRRKVFRMIDFLSFNIILTLKLLFISKKKYDVIIGMTSPPLLSFLGLKIARLKGIHFIYWTMDLQPELSIVAGYLSSNNINSKLLQSYGDYIFKNSDKIITLDKYMVEHINKRVVIDQNKIDVIPVWPVMNEVYHGKRIQNPFRIENNFGDRFVIMYSGNHSVMHPLTTLLETSRMLKNDDRFLFVHIGSGVRLDEVKTYKRKYDLSNLLILPYQPRNKIHLSLGSADMQVVSMGSDCVGYTHPNKIYGAMFIGKPILYLGPEKSHVSDIINNCSGNISAKHGEHDHLYNQLIDFIKLTQKEKETIGHRNRQYALSNFKPDTLIDRMVTSVETIKK